MSDEKQGVTVHVHATVSRINHPKGTAVRVADGHLFVQNSVSPTDVVAVYAPGKWLDVVVH